MRGGTLCRFQNPHRAQGMDGCSDELGRMGHLEDHLELVCLPQRREFVGDAESVVAPLPVDRADWASASGYRSPHSSIHSCPSLRRQPWGWHFSCPSMQSVQGGLALGRGKRTCRTFGPEMRKKGRAAFKRRQRSRAAIFDLCVNKGVT